MWRIAFIFLFSAITFNAFAQGEANSLKGTPFKDRLVTGGGFGLGFGNVQDYVSVSPVIGYMLTRKLMTGTSVSYTYTNFKPYKLKLHHYGVGPFVRYTIYKTFFTQVEYEYLNYQLPVSQTKTTRQEFTSLLAGGGIIQPLGRNAALYLMAMYNLSYVTPRPGQYSPYDSPWVIRAGINIGNFGF